MITVTVTHISGRDANENINNVDRRSLPVRWVHFDHTSSIDCYGPNVCIFAMRYQCQIQTDWRTRRARSRTRNNQIYSNRDKRVSSQHLCERIKIIINAILCKRLVKQRKKEQRCFKYAEVRSIEWVSCARRMPSNGNDNARKVKEKTTTRKNVYIKLKRIRTLARKWWMGTKALFFFRFCGICCLDDARP